METRCYRKILRISYKDYVINEEVLVKIQQAIGTHEDLQCIAVSLSSSLAKTILQGTGKVGRRRQTEEEVGRQYWGMDRPGVRKVPEGNGEHKKMEETGCEIICGAPTTFAVKELMMMMMMMKRSD